MTARPQTSEEIVRNGESLREPGALQCFSQLLDGKMSAEEAVHCAVYLEVVRLQEAGKGEDGHGAPCCCGWRSKAPACYLP